MPNIDDSPLIPVAMMKLILRLLKYSFILFFFILLGAAVSKTLFKIDSKQLLSREDISPLHFEKEIPLTENEDDFEFAAAETSSSSADADINEIIKAKHKATLQNNPILIQTEEGFIVKTLDSVAPPPEPPVSPIKPQLQQLGNRDTQPVTPSSKDLLQFRNGESKPGKIMNVSQDLLKQLRLPPAKYTELDSTNVKNFVFAIGSAEDTFKHSLGAVASIQKYFINHKIVYVDLGLDKKSVAQVHCWHNVIYRNFAFDRYPAHVRDLTIYAWRPLATMDILMHSPGVLWLDASTRLETSKIDTAYKKATDNGGVVMFHASGHSIYSGTHPSTYLYIPVQQEELKKIRMWSASTLLIYNTQELYESVLHWWYLCSLDKNCLSPAGITRPCWPLIQGLGLNHFDTYFKFCHRFEISVLNILLSDYYKYIPSNYLVKDSDIFFKGRRTSAMSSATPKTQLCFS